MMLRRIELLSALVFILCLPSPSYATIVLFNHSDAERAWLSLDIIDAGTLSQRVTMVSADARPREQAVLPVPALHVDELTIGSHAGKTLAKAVDVGRAERAERAALATIRVEGSGGLGELANVIDYEARDQQGFTADVIGVVLPLPLDFKPMLAIGHQYTDLNEDGRFGMGAGTRWDISRAATLGTEFLVFPADANGTDIDGMNRPEVRGMIRLEMSF